MNIFECDVPNTVKKVSVLTVTLKYNAVSSSNHAGEVIEVLKDSGHCEDFRLYLKMLEVSKIKGNNIDIELMLVELEIKCANLVKQT